MTRKEFKKSVADSAKSVLKRYGLLYRDMKINESLSTISFANFFSQGEFTDELINDAPKDINLRSCLLFSLDCAGAI